MSNISIIGTGNMASTIATLAVAGGNTVEVIGRDQSKAADLVKTLGGSTTTGEFGAAPAGDIVIVALRYADVVPVVTQYARFFGFVIVIHLSLEEPWPTLASQRPIHHLDDETNQGDVTG